MSVDIFQSRRNYNEFCRWWSRNEDDQYEANELISKRVPSGVFNAKEESPENLRNNVVADSFMFDSSHTMIKTPDNIMGIKNNDLIEYQGEFWIVVNVQKSKAKIQNTRYAYDKNCSHYWYLQLRK